MKRLREGDLRLGLKARPLKRARAAARQARTQRRAWNLRFAGPPSGLQAELKNLDTALSFSFDTTGEIPATGQLALVAQGDTENNREGCTGRFC